MRMDWLTRFLLVVIAVGMLGSIVSACSDDSPSAGVPANAGSPTTELPCTPASSDEGCGTLTGRAAFPIRSGIVSGVEMSKDDFPRWSVTIMLEDQPCACKGAVAVACNAAREHLLVSVSQAADAGTDLTGTHRIGSDPNTAAGVYMYRGTFLPDGGLTTTFPAYEGDFAPGAVELRVVDGGVVGSFETMLADGDGGQPTPLAGSFFARSCPDAFVPVNFSP